MSAFRTDHTTVYVSLDFVRDNPGEPVPEETFAHSHLSGSSIIPYLLPPTNMIHGKLCVFTLMPSDHVLIQEFMTMFLLISVVQSDAGTSVERI